MASKFEEMHVLVKMTNTIQVEACLTNELRNKIFVKFEKEELLHHLQLAMFSIYAVKEKREAEMYS
jgi:hypothetical protein